MSLCAGLVDSYGRCTYAQLPFGCTTAMVVLHVVLSCLLSCVEEYGGRPVTLDTRVASGSVVCVVDVMSE